MTVGIKQATTYVQNGLASDICGVKTPTGQGLSVPSLCRYTIIPQTNDDDYICSPQAVTANQNLALRTTYASTYNGQTVVLLDCARSVQVESSSALVGTAYTAVVTGYDINYKYIQETVTIAVGQTRGYSVKMFLMVISVLSNFTAAFNVRVGTYLRIGLPFYLRNRSSIDRVVWNDQIVDIGNVSVGYAWRTNGNISATTSDGNGFISLPSNPDGAIILIVQYYCFGADSKFANDLTNQVTGTFPSVVQDQQVTTSMITFANVKKNTSNTMYAYGGITPFDLIGPQYPQDSASMYTYKTVLSS